MSKKRNTDLVKADREEEEESPEAEMSFFDHLEVLRWHIIRSVIAIIVFASLAWTYYTPIFNNIILGPKRADFWTYRMFCLLDEKLHINTGYCITKDIPFSLLNTQPAGQFTLMMNSSLLIGLIFGAPYLLFELWRFIKPGLKDVERKSANGFVFYASLLFISGILFGYFIICPVSISFLTGFIVSSDIVNSFAVDEYMSFVGTLTLGTGIIFELPILIFILSKMSIMTPKFMRSTRRYAVVAILVIAAVVTPTPDVVTMMIVATPLFGLYELSIMVSQRVENQRKKAEAAFYSGA
jgi:sec-independent protein translocase protein TatC